MSARTTAALLAATATLALPAAGASAAGWAPPTRVATAPFVSPAGVALAPDGTMTAAYVRRDASNGNPNLEVRVKPPGGELGPAKALTTSGAAGEAQLVSDAQGDVAVIWTEYAAGIHRLRGVTKPAEGAFTAPQTIADTGSDVQFPSVGIADGKAVATWVQSLRVRAATAQAGAPFQVHDPLTGSLQGVEAPIVGVGPGGAAVVAWSTGASLRAAARAAGGEFAPLSEVQHSGFGHDLLQIAMSAEGRATLAWQYWDGGKYVLQAASRGKTGDFGGVETVDGISGAYGSFRLGKTPDGTAVLAWPDAQELRYAVRPEGGGFGATQAVAGSHGGYSIPQLAAGADGAMWAAWRGSFAGPIRVETARIAPDGSSSAAQDVAAPANPGLSDSSEGFYAIDADGQGNAAVLWTHNVGPIGAAHQAVETRVLDAQPPALTSVDVPATALTGRPVTMSAAGSDALSAVSIRWTLSHKLPGGQGPSIVRTFATPGTYTVQVEAVDGGDNRVTQLRQIEVAPDPNPCPEGQICE